MYPRPLLGTIKGEVRERIRKRTQVIHSRATLLHPRSYHACIHPCTSTWVQDNTNTPSPARRRAFSCPNQDKSLCLFLHHHLERGTCTSFTRWCDPPGGKHRQYGRKAHTSGLHRDINVPRNYLTSRRLQKPRERSGGETGPGPRRPPRRPGRPPPC